MVENGMVLYDEPEYNPPVCPICGRECETIYYDKYMDVVGCDECIETRDAWDWQAEQDERAS